MTYFARWPNSTNPALKQSLGSRSAMTEGNGADRWGGRQVNLTSPTSAGNSKRF